MKHVRNLDLLNGTPESPQEHSHMSRRKLMSPQECQIDWCTPNQNEMKPNSPAFAPEPSHVPNHAQQVAWLPLGNSRDSLRHPSQVYMNTNFSRATRGKLSAPQILSTWELIPRLRLKKYANFPKACEGEAILSNRYVIRTLSFLPQVELTLRCPDLKKDGFPCSGLNAGSSFISQDEGMFESHVDSLEKALGPRLLWTRGLTSIDTSRGMRGSMLQKVTMPDSSWKLIEIPISLWKLERVAWCPASPPEASVLSCQD